MSAADVLGLVGSTVDQIRFDECIAAGRIGAVYRGRHVVQGGPLAIKFVRLIHRSPQDKDAIVARFHAERDRLREISQGSDAIERVMSSGELFAPTTGERAPYLVVEWLEGHTLRLDLEQRRRRSLGARSLAEALDLLESAALATAHAHAHGLLHQSLEPKKLCLTHSSSGGLRAKVLDLGLATILEDDASAGERTVTTDDLRAFSPAYAAPEQLAAGVGEIGPWTDIYSLSLVLLEVLVGERVRRADSFASALAAALDPSAGSPRASSLGLSLPRPIEDLLARAVAQNPLERPANASIFWSALRELARESAPPHDDTSALATTAYDGTVADAMLRVRAAAAAGLGASIAERSPFTGTLLMANAPTGALHLLSPAPTAPAAPTAASARADADPPFAAKGERAGSEPTPQPAAPPAGSAPPAGARVPSLSPNMVTVAMAVPSPLAASFGPGVPSPLVAPPRGAPPRDIRAIGSSAAPPNEKVLAPEPAQIPRPARPPVTAPAPPAPSALAPASPGGAPRETPSSTPRVSTTERRSSGLVVPLLVLLVLVVAVSAGILLLRAR
jgi:serine/threonine-protein kinase